ncbi:hypothetical protein [Oceanirhabdus sp. W0125-5]|uniref:hypothetical protein n=1 Tax=Oceanirhabdus sp. W0125-5 TaxID=2999116 RepID=UPI0022F31961|nr:hypothetical protein [Oceanirhabdus sp. W0125-5]WBW99594.1 hypothetical protein OW730_12845 [Oceanirhabdus sp. W0125-5]
MKLKDFLWALVLVLLGAFLAVPQTREIFETLTSQHPYLMGFVKVSILATMGELLASRIAKGEFIKPIGVFWKFIVWGFFGIAFAVVFKIFGAGTVAAAEKGLLPTWENASVNKVSIALLTSFFMNTAFAPTFMALHRILDTFIELGDGKINKIFKVSLVDVCEEVDWYGYVSFVILKTVPFFWIPAHTITFMLPEQYRVLMAAMLSIALGAILAYSKRKK